MRQISKVRALFPKLQALLEESCEKFNQFHRSSKNTVRSRLFLNILKIIQGLGNIIKKIYTMTYPSEISYDCYTIGDLIFAVRDLLPSSDSFGNLDIMPVPEQLESIFHIFDMMLHYSETSTNDGLGHSTGENISEEHVEPDTGGISFAKKIPNRLLKEIYRLNPFKSRSHNPVQQVITASDRPKPCTATEDSPIKPGYDLHITNTEFCEDYKLNEESEIKKITNKQSISTTGTE